jgi:type I restriction enzyme S subunit
MGLKPGFKPTEVGVIPDDWDTKALGEIGEALIGLTYKSTDVREHGILVLRSSNIQNDALEFEDNVFVEMSIPERIRTRCGDVLVCVRNGSRDLIGKSAFLDERTLGMTFGAFMAVYRSPIGKLASYLFQSAILKRQNNEHLGATINQITNKSFSSFRIPYPPCSKERDAIAGALADVDGLLSGLDRIIAKKRDLKQAAMQQLLTGQTRLPGFSGEWEQRTLSQVTDIRSGGTPSTSESRYWDGDVLWCTPTDITALRGHKCLSSTARRITSEGLAACSAELIPPRSVVMTSRATIGECAINTVPLCTNQGFKNFVPFESTDADFLYYLLTTQKQGFVSLCGGSTFLEIGKAQLAAYAVRVPGIKVEQTAIASVLSDINAEIAVLEQRRDKTRSLKQAMMQELFTGKIRLVTPEAANA